MTAVCLIGFGEVGQILGADLSARGVSVAAWDPKFADAASGPSRALSAAVRRGQNAADAARGAEIVISAVTADQAVAAARDATGGLGAGTLYVDFNSTAPGTKAEGAAVITAAGGIYIEAAVMSPVPPKRLLTPILLGGPGAKDAQPRLAALGFGAVTFHSQHIGDASAVKMCRSVIIKGMEALLTESMLSARHYGVEGQVLGSLGDLLTNADWPKLARYMISRSLEHGGRRAEEMREAAKTVAAAGVAPTMTDAVVARQQWAAQFKAAAAQTDLGEMLDAINSKARV